MLTKVDRAALAIYCDAWADYYHAHKLVKEQGHLVETRGGGRKKNPAHTLKKEAATRFLQLADRFGLNPSARTRLEAPNSVEDQQSPMEKFLSRAKKTFSN